MRFLLWFLVIIFFGSYIFHFYSEESQTKKPKKTNLHNLVRTPTWEGILRVFLQLLERVAGSVWKRDREAWDPCLVWTLIQNHRPRIEDPWSWSESLTKKVANDSIMILYLVSDLSRTKTIPGQPSVTPPRMKKSALKNPYSLTQLQRLTCGFTYLFLGLLVVLVSCIVAGLWFHSCSHFTIEPVW